MPVAFPRTLLPLALVLCLAPCAVAQTIPAFPGAEGYGGYAKGGRGGDVYHVTNLNTSGVGSFADAIATVPGAGRTIVFDVSGHIHVNKTQLSKSKVTIAGQTAPGDGIGFKDGTFIISGDDIVIRHARFRYGAKAAGGDCIDLTSGTLNAILDQVSIQFSTDENISSFNSPPENLTMQWALNGWGLESHSCGGLWDQNHASSLRSIWAHNHTRNPKARPNGLLEWINNITFDWDIGFIMGDSNTPASWKANVRGCYFLSPPGNLRTKALEKANLDRNGNPNFSLYLDNCLHDADGDGLLNGTNKGYGIASGSYITAPAPFAATGSAPVTIDPPLLAFKKVVSKAGALRLDVSYAGGIRDEVDAKMVNNVLTQKRQHISKESQLGLTNGGFGTLNSAPAPLDTDRDGMPDFYETALGWNPAVQDHNTALPNSGGVITGTSFMPAGTVAGYTRLEEYLHFLAIPHGTVAKNIAGSPSSIEVDLRKFTMGFVKSPVFTTSNLLNGTVTQSGTGGYLVTFIPTVNYVGRAKFDFTVTDSDGSAWTQTCALLVAASGVPRDLRWKGGAAANAWDDTNTNWLRNGAPISFSFGDRVSFDDTGSLTPAVAVTGTVNPSAVDVSAAGNYTLGGTGAITSTGPLNKRGAGTLTIANTGANTFTATTLEEGAITLANATANSSGLGSGALTLNDGTLNMYDAGAGGGFTGTLPTPLIINGDVALNAPSRGGTSGALSGAGTLNLYIPYVRMDWGGDPALFTGTLNVITPAGGGEFRINNGGTGAVTDYGNARVRLSDRTTAYFLPNPPSGGDKTQTVQVGELSTSGTGIGVSLGGASGAGDRFVHWKVGALNTDATFGGAIVNRTGPAMLTKVGAGTLTLTGASTHTGATTVSAGTLRVNGSLGNTPVTVASGATLAGSGQIGGTITAPSGAIVAPGGSDGSAGTLTAAGGFSATSATFNLDLSNSPAGANDKIYVTGGSSFVGGNNTFVVNFKDGVLGAGVYKLIECAPGVAANAQSGVGLTLVTSAPTGTRQTFTMGRDASGTLGGNVRLTVVGSTANLTWVGALNAATWDLNTTANFTGAMPGTFYNLDSITFDDTSANRTVTLAGSLAPNIATVNTTLGYTLGGAGTLDGPAALVKNGTGPLTFAGSAVNTFTGGLTLNGGNIVLTNDTANAGALGTGPVTMNAGTISMFSNMATYNSFTANLVVPAGATARLNADARVDMYGTLTGAGTLNFYIPSIRTDLFTDWSGFTGTLNVLTSGSTGHLRMAKGYNFAGFPAAAVNLGPNCGAYYTGTLSGGEGTTVSFGQLSGAATSFLNGGATGGRAITYRIGGLGTDAIFAGVIAEQNDGTTTSYIKTGAGIWTLTGSGTWNGGTTVEQGTLKISGNFACGSASNVLFGAAIQFLGGSLATDALNIAEGATCTGHGTITGDLNNDGTLTVGTGGTLTVNGEVVNNGVMRFTGGSALVASGGFINNGTLDLLTAGGGLPPNLENNGLVVDSSSLRMVAAAKSGNTVTLSVMTYAGHVYQMQRADSLLAPNWGNVGPARAGNDAVQAFIDAAATGSGGFYRVAVTP